MDTAKQIIKLAAFIEEYAACLLSSGVHTSRVLRNSRRIGESLGVTVQMVTFHQSIILSVADAQSGEAHTKIVNIPALSVNFEYNSELSALSWEACDRRLTLAELQEKYRQIRAKPGMSACLILLLAALANASFCRLFGGDAGAVGVVFCSTLAGFFIRQQMHRRAINHFLVVTVSAFVSSICASAALFLDSAATVAIASSVLYLIPGVPLINGVIDIVEGHTLTGISRLIQAFLVIICITLGMSFSLLLLHKSLL
jgi:uncharacterized membrane protein YjjP (DUF1212 family)